jgi:hypothetical protein
VIAAFEVDWLGGPTARLLRRRRAGVDALPWAALDPAALDPATAARAREVWTEGAFSEYASAAAFAALAAALLEAGAPIDLTAMAADFVVDELGHVELNARLAAATGGAAPHLVDLEAVAPVAAPGPAIVRAAELAIRTSTIGEGLSVPVLACAARTARHPLARAVLARIVRDEGPHARLGALVLAWAGDRLAPHRPRLCAAAAAALAAYAPLWRTPAAPEPTPPPGAAALGLLDGATHRRVLRRAVRRRALPALAAAGLAPTPAELDVLLGDAAAAA